MVIGEQVEAVSYDLDRLYDDQFIETCAPWVIPYIGDLIGYQSIEGVAAAVDDPRAEVADTISMRRRKGTILVLEELARDVTGWSAHAVEFFKTLGDTQNVNHIRPWNAYAPDLRNWRAGAYVDTAFDETSHRVDVRRIEPRRGRYNIQNIGIFLWTLGAYGVSDAPGARRPPTRDRARSAIAFIRSASTLRSFTARSRKGIRSSPRPSLSMCADRLRAAAALRGSEERRRRRVLWRDGEPPLHPEREAGRSLSNSGSQPLGRGWRMGERAAASPYPSRCGPRARPVRL